MVIYKKSLAMKLVENGHELLRTEKSWKEDERLLFIFNDTVALIEELAKIGIKNVVIIRDFDLVVRLLKDNIIPFKSENGAFFFNNTTRLKNKIE